MDWKMKWFQTGWENYCAAQDGGRECKANFVNRRGAHCDEIKVVHFGQTWKDLEKDKQTIRFHTPFMSLRTHRLSVRGYCCFF